MVAHDVEFRMPRRFRDEALRVADADARDLHRRYGGLADCGSEVRHAPERIRVLNEGLPTGASAVPRDFPNNFSHLADRATVVRASLTGTRMNKLPWRAIYAMLPPNARFHYAFGSTNTEGTSMASDPGTRMSEAAIDAASLYREEIYTDRKVGTLRVRSR